MTPLEKLLLARSKRILEGLDVARLRGVEIGPLVNPIMTRDAGSITYVDHATTEDLRAKYAADPSVDVTKIVAIDAVWGDDSLAQALQCGPEYDYVVTSHVIEHVPDLITWLAEIEAILKDGGSHRLAIPDRRFTFDFFRRETRLPEVLDAWMQKARRPLPSAILDFYTYVANVDLTKAWQGRIDSRNTPLVHGPAFAIEVARSANDVYHDAHCWVFTPRSFGELMVELASVGLLNFSCERFLDTRFMEFEFIVSMSKCSDKDKVVKSWRDMAAQAQELPSRPAPPMRWLSRIVGAKA